MAPDVSKSLHSMFLDMYAITEFILFNFFGWLSNHTPATHRKGYPYQASECIRLKRTADKIWRWSIVGITGDARSLLEHSCKTALAAIATESDYLSSSLEYSDIAAFLEDANLAIHDFASDDLRPGPMALFRTAQCSPLCSYNFQYLTTAINATPRLEDTLQRFFHRHYPDIAKLLPHMLDRVRCHKAFSFDTGTLHIHDELLTHVAQSSVLLCVSRFGLEKTLLCYSILRFINDILGYFDDQARRVSLPSIVQWANNNQYEYNVLVRPMTPGDPSSLHVQAFVDSIFPSLISYLNRKAGTSSTHETTENPLCNASTEQSEAPNAIMVDERSEKCFVCGKLVQTSRMTFKLACALVHCESNAVTSNEELYGMIYDDEPKMTSDQKLDKPPRDKLNRLIREFAKQARDAGVDTSTCIELRSGKGIYIREDTILRFQEKSDS